MRRLLALPIVLALVAGGSAAAGGGAQVGFAPQSTTAPAGAEFSVDVTVSGIDPEPGLAAYDLTLSFDPDIVRLDSLADSGFTSGSENLVICVTGQIDNVAGSVNAVCTAVPLFGAPGVSTVEPVPLLHASFTALAEGTSSLTLVGSLSGPDKGQDIAATFEAGSVEVTAANGVQTPVPRSEEPALPAAGTGTSRERNLHPALALAAAGAIGIAAGRLILRRRFRD